jgi:hypothetical protein
MSAFGSPTHAASADVADAAAAAVTVVLDFLTGLGTDDLRPGWEMLLPVLRGSGCPFFH